LGDVFGIGLDELVQEFYVDAIGSLDLSLFLLGAGLCLLFLENRIVRQSDGDFLMAGLLDSAPEGVDEHQGQEWLTDGLEQIETEIHLLLLLHLGNHFFNNDEFITLRVFRILDTERSVDNAPDFVHLINRTRDNVFHTIGFSEIGRDNNAGGKPQERSSEGCKVAGGVADSFPWTAPWCLHL